MDITNYYFIRNIFKERTLTHIFLGVSLRGSRRPHRAPNWVDGC